MEMEKVVEKLAAMAAVVKVVEKLAAMAAMAAVVKASMEVVQMVETRARATRNCIGTLYRCQ